MWYPRAGTLGGCTAHNAMILLVPSNSDWDQIADLTGDPSWRAPAMRKYFQRIENCRHRPYERFWQTFGSNPIRHGWSGWLPTENAVPARSDCRRTGAAKSSCESVDNNLKEFGCAVRRAGSLPSAIRTTGGSSSATRSGPRYLPLTTNGHQRVGTRERLLAVANRHPDRLRIELHALATRVLFDDSNRAVGVEYQKGERLYAAHPGASSVGRRDADGAGAA